MKHRVHTNVFRITLSVCAASDRVSIFLLCRYKAKEHLIILQSDPPSLYTDCKMAGHSVFLFPSLSNNFLKCRSVSGMGNRVNKKVSIVPVIIPVWLKNETKKERRPIITRARPQNNINFEE